MKTIKQLSARTKQLAKTSKKLAGDIHNHMVDIAEFINETGNVTPALDLFNAIHTAVRRDAVKNWFEIYAACKFSKDKETETVKVKRNKDIALGSLDLDAARAESPCDLTPEKPWQEFDLMKAVAALVKRAETKASEETPEGKSHKIDKKVLKALRTIAS